MVSAKAWGGNRDMNNPGFREVANWWLEDLGEKRNPSEKKLRLSTLGARRDKGDHSAGTSRDFALWFQSITVK